MSDSDPTTAYSVEQFQQRVLAADPHELVLVDFYADWCQPCRMLAPVLEQIVTARAGAVRLEKVNIDTAQQLAGQYGVQSIPCVLAFQRGQLLDRFEGLLPAEAIERWLDELGLASIFAEAAELEKADPGAALNRYRELCADQPRDDRGKLGVVRTALQLGELLEAEQMLERLAARGFLEPEAERLQSQLTLRRGQVAPEMLQQLRSELHSGDVSPQLRLRLAAALAGAGECEEALERYLEVVQSQTGPLKEEARRGMLDIFRVLPDGSELTSRFRRQLAMALY
jgi:putative thioredoxin